MIIRIQKTHHIILYDFMKLFSLSGSSYFGKYTTTILKKYIPPSFFFVTLILLIWIANRVSSLPTATCVSSNSEWMNSRTFFQKHFLRLILSSFLFNIQCWWTKKLVIYWILILILLTLLFHSSYLFFLSSD